MSRISIESGLVDEIFDYLNGMADGVEDAPFWAKEANDLANRLAYVIHSSKVRIVEETTCTE